MNKLIIFYDDEEIINALELGADDYVTKPFNPHDLQAVLIKHMDDAGGG